MGTWNFFFVPRWWQGEKYLSLYWEHVTYFYANHMNRNLQWLLCCWNWSNKPLPWWEGVMSRQHLSWSYVLGLACCVGAFYYNHVLNIFDLQFMHIFEHNIFFYRKKLLRQTESFWQVGNLFLLFFYKLILWLFYTCK